MAAESSAPPCARPAQATRAPTNHYGPDLPTSSLSLSLSLYQPAPAEAHLLLLLLLLLARLLLPLLSLCLAAAGRAASAFNRAQFTD